MWPLPIVATPDVAAPDVAAPDVATPMRRPRAPRAIGWHAGRSREQAFFLAFTPSSSPGGHDRYAMLTRQRHCTAWLQRTPAMPHATCSLIATRSDQIRRAPSASPYAPCRAPSRPITRPADFEGNAESLTAICGRRRPRRPRRGQCNAAITARRPISAAAMHSRLVSASRAAPAPQRRPCNDASWQSELRRLSRAPPAELRQAS